VALTPDLYHCLGAKEPTKSMSAASKTATRLCPACAADEPVQSGEPVWPPGWCCPACGYRLAGRDGISIFAPELADTSSGFDPACFSYLASVEATHFWFVVRNELIVGLVNRFFPDARTLLEIGCGNGAVLRALAGTRRWERLIGSDLHPSGLATARARVPQAEFVQMDAKRIPAQNAFDLIGAFDVLEHIADDEAVLRAMRQALVPTGGVILAVPQHPLLWGCDDEMAHHERRYRQGELEAKLGRNGFEVLFSSSFVALLLPLMVASRLTARLWPPRDYDVTREFRIGPYANRMLTAILRAEVRLTLAGVRWPIGGSRVVVARAVPVGS
jgi:SAM-dependent methyltransferase